VVTPQVTEALKDLARAGHELQLDDVPGPYETAFVLPIVDGETKLGAVLLLFAGDLPEAGVEAGAYLGRHLALALKNLGRFAEVEDLVYLDDLTHLFNSRYLELVLDKEFKNATRAEKPFSLLFLDLDYFKSVNDTHGHVVGSKLLVEVSRVLKACVRDNDVVCRWGGDEYVLLLRGTDSGGALKVAERIRRAVESHRFLAREGFGLNITTCIGIASYPEHAQEKDALLDFADRAMYRGKKGTRNIIYMASKGLEATPAARHQTSAPES
jgi:diguanylate cyclase (GGDEF)-like protein